ncbi:STAS domain-containing protein [Nocardiopsis ansamitocini]|uniref:Anti-sigma factor antagonist n=1 Tax=Nocardiopsis ansamitocini TaxID=1670832 RepID=A0A9W6P995_9ACTN|nr:STAS domain-containing protein [Nocardiopsis ansamitocini]GLU49515.1 anti-sigma factor antagonist [Nocardiopsis ansamitocini]
MSQIPVIPLGDVLFVSIQGELYDAVALSLQDDVTNAIQAHNARGVIIDISALDMVDSFLGRVLAEIAGCSRLLGADTVVTGMRPAVAITLVELGLTLPELRTARTVEDAALMLGVWVSSRTSRAAPVAVRQDEPEAMDGGSGTDGP